MAFATRVPDALAMIPHSGGSGRGLPTVRPKVGKVWALHYHSISCVCHACKHADIVLMGLTEPVLDWDIDPNALRATESQDLPVPFIGVQTG
jgi:hypothetical protein